MEFSKITVILRGYNLQEVKTLAELMLKSKHLKNIEVTLNTESALEIIKSLSDQYKGRLNIGAGTVLDLKDLKAAIAAGAEFVLSPVMMSQEMIAYCKKHNVISIPGAYSPSEIYQAHAFGADIIKVFPANELSKNYARKVIEPLGSMELMAVGGVNHNNLLEHFEAGYSHLGSAGGIFNPLDIINQDFDKLSTSIKEIDEIMDNLIDVKDKLNS